MKNMQQKIKETLKQSVLLKLQIIDNKPLIDTITNVSKELIYLFKKDQKVLFCGNGGSAADAQHLATELSGRFYLERAPLFAEALSTNTSFLTAVGNDYNFDTIFARAVAAKGREGDALIAISTSGKSKNVLNAIAAAKEKNMLIIGMTGEKGGKMLGLCDYLIQIPSKDTPRIQEAHILIGHIICELVEAELFGKK
ncbi:MAG: SIS domain-containing protein [Saprospiraceae bacterium]